jgi:hypothetical protein
MPWVTLSLFSSACYHTGKSDPATTFHPFGNLLLACYPVTLSSGEIFSGGESSYDKGNRQFAKP